jgi:hypothetical protein
MTNTEAMDVIAILQKNCDVLAIAVRSLQSRLSEIGDLESGFSLEISNQIHQEVGEAEYEALFAGLDGML